MINIVSWSKLAGLHPCKNDHPSRVSNYRQFFDEWNNEGFDISNGFRYSNVHKFEKLISLSFNKFELNFYQYKNKWKHNSSPFEISKNDSDKVIDFLIYRIHFALIKEINVLLGDHHKNFNCRRCLNLYTSEYMLVLQKPKWKNYDITTIRTSLESHLHWKKHFHMNPEQFRINANFEADKEIDNSSICNRTTNFYKQNPVFKGYQLEFELDDIFNSGYYKSPLGYNNVDWFVNEII